MDKKFESFEEALSVLKSTVGKFEGGQSINLDDLIKNYECGMTAYNYCINKLEETQKKIKIIESDMGK